MEDYILHNSNYGDYGGLWMIMVGGAKRILRIPSNDFETHQSHGAMGPIVKNGWL